MNNLFYPAISGITHAFTYRKSIYAISAIRYYVNYRKKLTFKTIVPTITFVVDVFHTSNSKKHTRFKYNPFCRA